MKRPSFTLSLIAAGLMTSTWSHADALLGPHISDALDTGEGPFKTIVTMQDAKELDPVLQSLNVPYLALKTLPMAGVTLSRQQIEALSTNPAVKSIYQDRELEYKNYTSGQITGGHFVQDEYDVTGRGSTVAVLDSGVDATHPDLELGTKTVENVKIVGDLDLAGGYNAFIEGVPNSDTSSGHGTHVAGTVGGTGAVSANDTRRTNYHAGIAPDANLIGLGAGEGVSILYGLLGFDYAIANRERLDIDIITNSWGGGDGAEFDPNNPINLASFEAYRKGMVVSFAASNSGPDEDTLNQYAIAPWVINVAAGTSDKTLADFSSRGVAGDEYKLPDITAPGQGITSTRAPNTAIGAMGPVTDLENPEYTVYYHTISGTSMATPFVAGVAALLLEVNRDLSPDQIESILKATAETMPDYAPHEVGAGYIDVKAAVEMAANTVGKRRAFLGGDTLWASDGQWARVDDRNNNLTYLGRWTLKDNNDAHDQSVSVMNSKTATIATAVRGDRVRLHFIMQDSDPRSIELISDGQSVGTATLYQPSASKDAPREATAVFDGLGSGNHELKIKLLDKKTVFDYMSVDGASVKSGITYTTREQSDSGTMGPSAENLEVQEFPVAIQSGDVSIGATLNWTGVADLDFYLVNPEGVEVASSASLDNPEALFYETDATGTYLLRVTGFISTVTPFEIDSTITSAE